MTAAEQPSPPANRCIDNGVWGKIHVESIYMGFRGVGYATLHGVIAIVNWGKGYPIVASLRWLLSHSINAYLNSRHVSLLDTPLKFDRFYPM